MYLNVSKKAIGPVVAITLLLVVTVVSTMGFQTWFNIYQSNMNSNVETQTSDSIGATVIEGIIANQLYIKNRAGNLTILGVELDGFDCNISGNYSGSILNFSLSNCIDNITTSTPEILVKTKSQIIQVKDYVKDVVNYGSSGGGSISTSLSCTTDSDGDGDILYTCAVYPMINTAYEGDLDVDDSDLIQAPDFSCLFSGDKSHCDSNFIIGGCDIDANGINDTLLDIGSGLCWQRNMSASGSMNWDAARAYCDILDLGGHTDWHLPSRSELVSITDVSRFNPAIVGGNNKFSNIASVAYYWSSSTFGGQTTSAWTINSYRGEIGDIQKSNNYRVVCVR